MPTGVVTAPGEVSDLMSENENECDEKEPKHEREDDGDHIMAEAPVGPSEVGTEPTGEVKKKYDAKDPSRPRRKKARRACFACQRAHLTCGELLLRNAHQEEPPMVASISHCTLPITELAHFPKVFLG